MTFGHFDDEIVCGEDLERMELHLGNNQIRHSIACIWIVGEARGSKETLPRDYSQVERR